VTGVPDAIRYLCTVLADPHVRALAVQAEKLETWSPGSEKALLSALPATQQPKLHALLGAWQGDPSVPGAAIGLSLHTALAVAASSDVVRVDVVCTGPNSMDTPVRLTSEVVCQLIDEACESVLVVSYAAYNVPRVIASLDAAVARGVKVTLVLESPEKLKNASLGKYVRYPVFCWPLESRPSNASLHAKVIAVDGSRALLTSANLTQAAYDENIELGLLVRGGTSASDIEAHFAGLIQSGVLVPA
jgi:phosphatidylserine/phosphatidylglycerophosphate/cardiolipin synthase-like enzyme